MIERELIALADRVAPPDRPDLPDLVLARIDEIDTRSGRGPARVRTLVAAGLAALLAASALSPQVRAFAADLLGLSGVELVEDVPDAPPEPSAPLPDSQALSLAEAQAMVDFPILLPVRLGTPDEVVVAGGGRVVSMSWRDGTVLLDQLDGRLGPVFRKVVRVLPSEVVRLGGTAGWWIDAPHDLSYITEDGRELESTARLAGSTLVWESGTGTTYRLEVERLAKADAVAIARSIR
jgi:hypothetical protein